MLPHFPFLVEDQRDISREIVLTAEAAADVVSAYGPLLPVVEDTTLPAPSLAAEAARIPAGVPYVLTVLTPPPEERFDENDLAGRAGQTDPQPPPRARAAGHSSSLPGSLATGPRSIARPTGRSG